MGKKAKIIAVVNNKGGVGKTMTAHNLSAAMADKGKNVCMIDSDSQHNLTNRCENKNRVEELQKRQYRGLALEDYLSNPELAICPLEVKKNLYLIPSTIELATYSASLYHLGLGPLMVNATKAADLIIIPINCLDALNGASEGVFGIMDNNNLNTSYYFLQTMYENRLKSSRDIRCQLLEEARENTFSTFIKRNEYLNSAGNYGLDIFEHAPKSGGASDYKYLASEVMSILKKQNKK